MTSQNVVLQIPAARFRSVYDQMLGLGEVLAKSLAARDVTDEFLDVEGRKAFEGQPLQEVRGLEWIGTLASDIRRDDRDTTRFSLATPVGMVELDKTRLWSASSPDGVTLTTQQRRNEPKGSAAWWLDALRWRLQGRFGTVEQKTAGDFALLRFVSTEAPHFIFWVAIAAKDDRFFVAQAYFPSVDREQRYEAQIMNSLRGGVK